MSFNTLQQQTLHYFSRPHSGLPSASIASPAAWRAADMADSKQWRYQLSPTDINEVQAAIDYAQATGKPLSALTKADFPLPSLTDRVAQWRQQVHHGRGFQVVRGLPVAQWSAAQSECFFWCLGQHLGIPGAQNRNNDLLGHVCDDGSDENDPTVRQYRTTAYIPYHCDAADIVGLLCLQQAQSGGQSRLVSSVSVMNQMLAQNRALALRMFEPIHLDAHHEGGVFSIPIPPCRYYRGKLRTFGHSHYFRTAARYPHIVLSDRDQQALALYDQLCADPDNYIEMDFLPGDVQLVSNHTVLHSRTHFTDYADPAKKRHLLRLWLSIDEPLSPAERWQTRFSRWRFMGVFAREKWRYWRAASD